MEALLDINGLQRITSIKVFTLRKYVAQKKIPFVKVGRLVRFRPSEIEKWLSDCSVAVEDDFYSGKNSQNQGILALEQD
jgi:excisionase family DNA binding protein